ncbi:MULTISPECIES: MarR family winged helix-turn-helix transcriptional regulator [unclassified Paraburkholderia]|uniref:MarR family winged helix-turn-helix transcriptional regulator n=1 Tax=unclassified Paraburkholderia TaxID=2615204 RepID=UPI0020B8EFA2|nr:MULTISPECIES: MarR family transcriptional regulator [unclassified Paraburkholderia]MCP3718273.1 MarR family transcriptional regulator [Paraburkholderia sp. CNPSo 3281]MCX5539289.1 MarR family transcriptional regulator [Paraburkholderia sp. CNPSo 3076]
MYSDFLTFRLDQTSALLMDRANAVYRERWDLDVRAMRVLRIIRAEPGITPKAVSQRALIEKTLLSKTLGELESRGLIGRGTHAQDRRSVVLRVTPEGTKVANASEKAGSKLEAELAAVLTDHERKTLDQLLAKLAQSLIDGV